MNLFGFSRYLLCSALVIKLMSILKLSALKLDGLKSVCIHDENNETYAQNKMFRLDKVVSLVKRASSSNRLAIEFGDESDYHGLGRSSEM